MSIELEILMKDAQFIASLLRGASAQRQWTTEVEKTTRASKQAETSLDRMAASVNRLHATPLQKYNAEVEKLDKLLAKAKISQDVHSRATAAAKTELDRATEAAKNFGNSGKMSAGDVAGSLGVVTTAAGAATAAIGFITTALSQAREEARMAAQDMDTLFGSRRTLNQVATSPEHLQKMLGRIDAGAATYGVDRKDATDIMADAVGSGFEKEYEDVLAAHAGGVDAREATRMTKKVLAIYRDKDPKLNARQTIDMTLAAAKPSELSFEDLASGVAQAAEGGSVVGSSSEETIAALSVLGGKFASVQTAADRMKGFGARAGTDERLKGKGLLGSFRALRDDFSEKERKKFLGDSQELNVMYQYLQENEQAIVERQGLVSSARTASNEGRGEIRQALARASVTPQLAAALDKQRAQRGLEATRENRLGVFSQQQEAALANADERALAENRNFIYRGGKYVATRGAQQIGLGGDNIERSAGAGGAAANSWAATLLLGPLAGAASLLQDAAGELTTSTKRKPPIHHAAQVEHSQQIN